MKLLNLYYKCDVHNYPSKLTGSNQPQHPQPHKHFSFWADDAFSAARAFPFEDDDSNI